MEHGADYSSNHHDDEDDDDEDEADYKGMTMKQRQSGQLQLQQQHYGLPRFSLRRAVSRAPGGNILPAPSQVEHSSTSIFDDCQVNPNASNNHADRTGINSSGTTRDSSSNGGGVDDTVDHNGETFEIMVLSDDMDLYTDNSKSPNSTQQPQNYGDDQGSPNRTTRRIPFTTPKQASVPVQLSPDAVAAGARLKSPTQRTTNDDIDLICDGYPIVGGSSAINIDLSKSGSYEGGDSWDSNSLPDENNNNNVRNSGQKNKNYTMSRFRNTGYAFDLGQTIKNEIMMKHNNSNSNHKNRSRSNSAGSGNNVPNNNLHAPTMMEVVAPYPMLEETSDSEADSWAQTDGTVGSLEERLEDITVEI
jgi:hypothetical protein